MLSIIICSISPERLRAIKTNLMDTVGDTEFEIIVIDNRDKGWSIAKAYNFGAKQAKYPYLFFVHEDVLFFAKGWGAIIEQKLAEPGCGVIGFAGSNVKFKAYSSCWQKREWEHSFICRRLGGIWIGYDIKYNLEHPFRETLILDGLGLFVRREVWERDPFDEVLLTGFHCYDVDFSMQIAKKYKNYVCCSPQILVQHFSDGNYNAQWFSDIIKMHQNKWNKFLPMMTSDVHLGKRALRKYEERAFYCFVQGALRVKEFAGKKQLMKEFWNYPLSYKHFVHCLVCSLKYFRVSVCKNL